MYWTGQTVLALGYGLAAAFAALMGGFGYPLIVCLGIFWMGGAILTVSLLALRLAFGPDRIRRARVRSNIVDLNSAAGPDRSRP